MTKKKLPVGTDNFEKIITHDFYYIDKTELIAELLNGWAEVNLFTRPRRFGKSLNMSMLKSFFEMGCDPALFEGLRISQEEALCQQYMGQFPANFYSLKGVDGLTFELRMYRIKGNYRKRGNAFSVPEAKQSAVQGRKRNLSTAHQNR